MKSPRREKRGLTYEVTTMPTDYRIGLYDESRNLIGYKADSFWSLTKRPENAKTHWLRAGKIPEHLISNLASILLGTHRSVPIIGALKQINKEYFFGNFETMLVGYSCEGGRVTFTHRVFTDGVEELSPEESGSLSRAATQVETPA